MYGNFPTFLRISSSFSVFSSSKYSWPCTPEAPVPGYTGYRDPGPDERFARYDMFPVLNVHNSEILDSAERRYRNFDIYRLCCQLSSPPRHARSTFGTCAFEMSQPFPTYISGLPGAGSTVLLSNLLEPGRSLELELEINEANFLTED